MYRNQVEDFERRVESATYKSIYKAFRMDAIPGLVAAEQIKINIGSAYPVQDDKTMDVRGNDMIARIPKTVQVSAAEIRKALQGPITTILEAVRATLDICPPELAADLIDRGIMLAGGGSLLRGLDRLISEETGLPVFVADDALKAVANGTGVVLQEMDNMSSER